MNNVVEPGVSVIVPTIGRPDSLRILLRSLARQTAPVSEVIVADGSGADSVQKLLLEENWDGLHIHHFLVQPPNAVRQRTAAINLARGDLLLLLDDDVELEATCVQAMLKVLDHDPDIVAVVADFNNQSWAGPTRAWKLYMRLFHGIREGEWQGRVVGPLLRFGYNPSPNTPMPMQWIGSGITMLRAEAYFRAGGFSNFFLHRCTMNEDVDLGLKLAQVGKIVLCPQARMAHHHAPGGRVPASVAAEDDLHNRYLVLGRTLQKGPMAAFGLVAAYFVIETISAGLGALRRGSGHDWCERTAGRARAVRAIIRRSLGSANP